MQTVNAHFFCLHFSVPNVYARVAMSISKQKRWSNPFSRVIRELNHRAARFLSMPLGAKILGSNFGRSGRSANSLGVGQPFKANFNI